jgi:hypothetical protein
VKRDSFTISNYTQSKSRPYFFVIFVRDHLDTRAFLTHLYSYRRAPPSYADLHLCSTLGSVAGDNGRARTAFPRAALRRRRVARRPSAADDDDDNRRRWVYSQHQQQPVRVRVMMQSTRGNKKYQQTCQNHRDTLFCRISSDFYKKVSKQ